MAVFRFLQSFYDMSCVNEMGFSDVASFPSIVASIVSHKELRMWSTFYGTSWKKNH